MLTTTPLKLDNAKKIYGWMTDGELSFLAETARKSHSILEIGSFQGRSTRALADNSDDGALIVCVDPWDYNISAGIKSDMETYTFFHANLRQHIKSGKVLPVKKRFEDYIPSIKFDFIFIDGDHRTQSVIHDINKAMKYLTPGGILAGHDYGDKWPDVKEVVDNFFPNVNLAETIWWKQL